MFDFDSELEKMEIKLSAYKRQGLRMFTTSSFQPQSAALLHIIGRIDNSIPVYFLNTGYHFPETLIYRDDFAKRYQLNIISISSPVPKIQQRDANGDLMFTSDPDYCCYMNKVAPLDPVLMQHDIWINGIRKGQNANRATMKEEEKSKYGVLRYHPILEWSSQMVFAYINKYEVPLHPMFYKGYFSIGCEPCTARVHSTAQADITHADDRSGRWAGMKKTECGLHTELVEK